MMECVDTLGAASEVGVLDAVLLVSLIQNQVNETDVAQLVARTVSALGYETWVFAVHCQLMDAGAVPRFLLGCHPQWCRLYKERRWHLNDPFLAYAQNNHRAIDRRQLEAAMELSPGQKELLAHAGEHGFMDMLAVPAFAHCGSTRMGLLYLGTSPVRQARRDTPLHRVVLQSCATQTLHWMCEQLRRNAIRAFGLDSRDLHVLRMMRQQFTARNIADELQLSLHTAKKICQSINQKLGAANRREALNAASEHELFSLDLNGS